MIREEFYLHLIKYDVRSEFHLKTNLDNTIVSVSNSICDFFISNLG